ncbi:MAG: hypothetical protein WDN03_06765 [Rhizomicrobium sp.]
MTMRLAKILIVSSALAILPAAAFAGANDGNGAQHQQPAAQGSTILNGQVTFGAQWSTVNTKVDNVGGDVVIQSQGAGNVLEAVTFDDTHVTSSQDAESTNIGSTVNAGVSNVGGSVSISGTAVCNSTDVSTDPNITAVNSTQYCGAQDPGSEVNANVRNVAGDVAIQSTAFGNNYTEDTNAANAPTQIVQTNTSQVFGTANATIRNVGGSVGVTSSAIGNNAQIVHYSTDAATTGGQ